MARIQKIQYKGKEILYVNYSGLREKEMIQLLNKVEGIILADNRPHLQLVNITDSFATSGYMAAVKEFGANTQHLTHKAAIIGISGVKGLLLKSYNFVSGSKLIAFSTEKEAKEYLVQ